MSFLPGQTLSAAELQALATVGTYTPVLSDAIGELALGSGSIQNGWYNRNGQKVDVWFHVRFGTSGTWPGSGAYKVTYPPGLTPMAGMPGFGIGVCRLVNTGVGEQLGYVIQDANYMYLQLPDAGQVTATSPWTWNDQDAVGGHVAYLIDA